MIENSLDQTETRRIEDFINSLNADQLSYLNRMIIERFRVLEKEKIEKDLQKFRLGEKVAFQDNEGIERKGVVIRINKKSISVHTDDRTDWKVHPRLLRKFHG